MMARFLNAAFAFAAALSASAAAEMPAIQPQPEKGFVFGTVTDAAGQPLGGVQVFIDGIGDNFATVNVEGGLDFLF